MGKYFGTDGVRGLANQQLTPELAFGLGLACGQALKEKTEIHTMIIGRDTRRSGPMLGAALAAGLASAGVNVLDGGVLPTPAVAYLARTTKGCGGAVISASHNPAPDNGIKFFGHQGYKLDDGMEELIEAYLEAPGAAKERPAGPGVGSVKRMADGGQRYLDYLAGTIDGDLKGLRVVVDCANGAASDLGPAALRQAGAQVISVNDLPDGMNINAGCGSTHLECLQEAVARYQADLGLAFDGDADRLLAVDADGNVVDGDKILVILGLFLEERGLLGGRAVVTVMSNLGLKKAFQQAGIEVSETKVGDRYVLERMLAEGALLGGEQSGHIILRDAATTGDGTLTALRLLSVVKKTGKTLAQLAGQMVQYPQVLVNVPVKTKEGWETNPAIQTAAREVEKALEGSGRLLLRPSGTEALIRVMAEGPDQTVLEELAAGLAEVIRREQG